MLLRTAAVRALLCAALLIARTASAEDARIVLLQGQGEKSAQEQPSAWSPATQGDTITGGEIGRAHV